MIKGKRLIAVIGLLMFLMVMPAQAVQRMVLLEYETATW